MELEEIIAKAITKAYRTIFSKKILQTLKEPKILVSIFLAGIMILSTLGFMFSYETDNTNELEYNGYEFKQFYGGMQVKINEEQIPVNYFPDQLEYLNLSKETKRTLKNAIVFSITYDQESEYKEYFAEQQFTLDEKLAKIEKYIISGIANNTSYEHIPQITCKNATDVLPVILFQEGTTTNITFNNNCIIINIASMNDAYQAGDLLFYQIAGIME